MKFEQAKEKSDSMIESKQFKKILEALLRDASKQPFSYLPDQAREEELAKLIGSSFGCLAGSITLNEVSRLFSSLWFQSEQDFGGEFPNYPGDPAATVKLDLASVAVRNALKDSFRAVRFYFPFRSLGTSTSPHLFDLPGLGSFTKERPETGLDSSIHGRLQPFLWYARVDAVGYMHSESTSILSVATDRLCSLLMCGWISNFVEFTPKSFGLKVDNWQPVARDSGLGEDFQLDLSKDVWHFGDIGSLCRISSLNWFVVKEPLN